MIQANNVTLRLGKRALFEDVNIKFTEGNCYGLIGANGAGKSTFLKILSGEIEPSKGDVSITSGQRLSVLKQDHYQYDDHIVLDTVMMGNQRLYEIMKEKEATVKNKLIENAKEVNGVKVIKAVLPMPADAVKNIAFQLKGQFAENLFVVIGSVFENKPLLTVTMSDDQVKAGLNAGQLVREAAKLIQGGGGGQPHFATAGGKNPDGLTAAVDKVIELAGF